MQEGKARQCSCFFFFFLVVHMLLHLASAHVSLREVCNRRSCEVLNTLKLVEFYRSHPLSIPKHDLALEKREGGRRGNKPIFRITHSIHNLSSINILISRGKRSPSSAVEPKQLRSSKLIQSVSLMLQGRLAKAIRR